MATEQQLQELANELGVSIHDVKMFVNSMVNSIEKDGMSEVFLSADQAMQAELVQAYAPTVVRKFNQFLTTYLTVPEAKFNIELAAFTELKARC